MRLKHQQGYITSARPPKRRWCSFVGGVRLVFYAARLSAPSLRTWTIDFWPSDHLLLLTPPPYYNTVEGRQEAREAIDTGSWSISVFRLSVYTSVPLDRIYHTAVHLSQNSTMPSHMSGCLASCPVLELTIWRGHIHNNGRNAGLPTPTQ